MSNDTNIGLVARENVAFEKQRRRPACASAQTNQRLRYSLSGKCSS